MMTTCERCRADITEQVRKLDIAVPPQGLICDDCCEKEDKEKAAGSDNPYTLAP